MYGVAVSLDQLQNPYLVHPPLSTSAAAHMYLKPEAYGVCGQMLENEFQTLGNTGPATFTFMRKSAESVNTFGVRQPKSGVAASHARDESEQSMAASSISDPPSITSSDEAPVIRYPVQSMAGSVGEVHNPLQSVELSSAIEVETVAQSLKRLESLIEKNTKTQEDRFDEIKASLSANFVLANTSIKLAHDSLQKANSALSLVKEIRNDTKGLGEVDASNKTLLARLKDLLLGVRLPALTAEP
ncbi:hypothetical protein EV702DRAFT_1052003 [Suillus placidus]|uniref:Uncharacterized protein n=1 Tax=Suillus placidus TaxID=48579 RepID=A0A9P6ZFE0_9AGAM|nr:hypothetical protein EV702DRAFT_1052003 [Suillus placidus]